MQASVMKTWWRVWRLALVCARAHICRHTKVASRYLNKRRGHINFFFFLSLIFSFSFFGYNKKKGQNKLMGIESTSNVNGLIYVSEEFI